MYACRGGTITLHAAGWSSRLACHELAMAFKNFILCWQQREPDQVRCALPVHSMWALVLVRPAPTIILPLPASTSPAWP
eukprot:scaffold270311_cov17-Prasinocladus_malaysianus.AAC.1